MNRNFWNRRTPAGFTDMTKRGFVVELCIYSFEHSAKDETQVREDVQKASAIWCQRGINVQASHWERLAPFAPSEPLDLNSHTLAEQIPCSNLSEEATNQLFGIGRPNCSSNSFESIAVYYIPRAHFQGNSSGSGCHIWRTQSIDSKPEHIILLTNEADERVLAHEIGHALFLRDIGSGKWINDDPDPGMDPNNRGHNTSPQNLMFPSVSPNPVISPEQGTQAQSSQLVSIKHLAYGYTDNKPYKVGVKMKTLQVGFTTDEAFSDDALESTWKFTVTAGQKPPVTKTLMDNRLGAGDRDISPPNQAPDVLDFPDLEPGGGPITIKVEGEDWDFWSANDILPELFETHHKEPDLWGSKSSSPTSAPLGDHTRPTPPNEPVQNYESMNYRLTYNVRVDQKPIEETFRDPGEIC
jgi:hypothetical protein